MAFWGEFVYSLPVLLSFPLSIESRKSLLARFLTNAFVVLWELFPSLSFLPVPILILYLGPETVDLN